MRDRFCGVAEENIEIVRRLFAAIRDRDLDTMLRLYDPEIQFRPLTGTRIESGGYRGHAGIRAYFDEAGTVWERMHPYADDLRVEGDTVVTIGHCEVRGRESGAETDTPMAWIFRVRNGRIVSTQAFSEVEDALGVAGLSGQTS
jgi:ketosteroid isomerase-like protein